MRRLSILLGTVLALSSLTSNAMVVDDQEVTCPIGGEKFTYMATMSGTSFGKTWDFRPIGMIQAPFALAKCPSNGLVI